ncbi:MAG: hypothetical protein WAU45_12110 [Blastocatellia bacterium]
MPRHLLPKPLFAMVVALTIGSTALADSPTRHSTESLARRALAASKAKSANAVAELRSMGPEGLRVFLETNRAEIEEALKTTSDSRNHSPEPADIQVMSALDSICQQKDCYASRLYWYTDLEQAKSAARAQGKPILSLRLLGRLDEDLSCANSRLFRITLYANEQVSRLLRERFVLHWQSVRPVPRVTIDFGDGRKMERTLTGNSIHYVLDSEGRVIDALPGMYGPGAFLRELSSASSAAAALNGLRTDQERSDALRRYHESRVKELENAWISDLKRAGLRVGPSREIPKLAAAGSSPPSALMAAAAAISKTGLVERPILRGMSDNSTLLESIGRDAAWSMIAGLHAEDANLDQTTRTLMSFKDPSLKGASLQAAITALERAVAEDTVRNEYVFRVRIHRWLVSGAAGSEVTSLNEKIYAELFLTPSWDAWLGLRPAGAYSGIDSDGVRR